MHNGSSESKTTAKCSLPDVIRWLMEYSNATSQQILQRWKMYLIFKIILSFDKSSTNSGLRRQPCNFWGSLVGGLCMLIWWWCMTWGKTRTMKSGNWYHIRFNLWLGIISSLQLSFITLDSLSLTLNKKGNISCYFFLFLRAFGYRNIRNLSTGWQNLGV